MVLSLGEGHATARFRQSNCWISHCLAAHGARAAARNAGGRLFQAAIRLPVAIAHLSRDALTARAYRREHLGQCLAGRRL